MVRSRLCFCWLRILIVSSLAVFWVWISEDFEDTVRVRSFIWEVWARYLVLRRVRLESVRKVWSLGLMNLWNSVLRDKKSNL